MDTKLLKVTQRMMGCHPNTFHVDYPLLPGDVLVLRDDGTYGKVAVGLGIEGFVLTPEQIATLEPTEGRIVIGQEKIL
jgi:hypothetical protein